jgi:hypothetical protein
VIESTTRAIVVGVARSRALEPLSIWVRYMY